jgi:hypothetical protein
MTNLERCSCGAREKNKCSKESAPMNGVQSGKMCLKDEDTLFVNFRDTLNGGFCADIDYESQAWQKVLGDWEGFKIEEQLCITKK